MYALKNGSVLLLAIGGMCCVIRGKCSTGKIGGVCCEIGDVRSTAGNRGYAFYWGGVHSLLPAIKHISLIANTYLLF